MICRDFLLNSRHIMFTASHKKQNNIAEYLLYMWQIEDIIRANNLDIDAIDRNIISQYRTLSDTQIKELREWYESLIHMMHSEGVRQSGHLQINSNILNDMADLHRRLLNDGRFTKYSETFYNALPFIVEIRAKAGVNKSGEIETCLNFLYGILLLRLQKKEISEGTNKAVDAISHLLAMLAAYYKENSQKDIFEKND